MMAKRSSFNYGEAKDEMIRSELSLWGAGGATLYVREWMPDNEPVIGVVCIVHGMGEQGERYRNVAAELTAAGFAVLALDQEGHGRSSGPRGHMPSIMDATANVVLVLEQARKRHPGAPLFIYGHSMGGNVALNTVLRRKPDIQGLIVTSPWLKLAFSPPAAQLWVGQQLAKFMPRLSQSTGLKPEDLFREGYEGAVPIVGDPLNHTRITIKTFIEINAAGEWAIEQAEKLLEVPLLLMHGSSDRVTSHQASAELASRLGVRCQFLTWEGCFHELHNDREGEKVIHIMIEWLKGQL